MRTLFDPVAFGSVMLRNRLVFPPVLTGYEERGRITPRSLHFYRTIASGGAGLIVLGSVSVLPTFAATLALDDDQAIPGLALLAEAVHGAGARLAVQLYYPEHSADGAALAASLTTEQVADIPGRFAAAARRARAAGVDAIQIHGGRLLGVFCAASTNPRTDHYAGPFDRRARLALDVVRAVRAATPELALDYKLPIVRTYPPVGRAGLPLAEARLLAAWLQDAGADALHVAIAEHDPITATIPPALAQPEAYCADLALLVKQVVRVPVCAVGRIVSPGIATQIVARGQADMVGLGRALLCDPEWPRKVQEGATAAIRPCLGCNRGCVDQLVRGAPIRCTLNAALALGPAGTIQPAATCRHVVVVGGGPAGMEAARVAAERGQRVTLLEREPRLGGWLPLLATMPGQQAVARVPAYYQHELARLGVNVRLGVTATPELVAALHPDQVVVATGAAGILQIPGSTQPHVVTAWEVLSQTASIGRRVVVIGGNRMGLSTAVLLGRQGHTVTLVEARERVGSSVGASELPVLLEMLGEYGISVLTGAAVQVIGPDQVVLDVDAVIQSLPVDTVVLAAHGVPDAHLVEALTARGVPVVAVGHAASDPACSLGEAISQGYQAGFDL